MLSLVGRLFLSCFNSQTSAAPSGSPTDFSATVLGSSSLSFSWRPPPLEQHNGILRTYIISLTSSTENKTLTVSSNRLSVNATGLRAYTTYVCNVLAVTIGMGPPTQNIEITTAEDGKL